MKIGLALNELAMELEKTDFGISADHLISGLLQNLFEAKKSITEEDLYQEIQVILANLKEYNMELHNKIA